VKGKERRGGEAREKKGEKGCRWNWILFFFFFCGKELDSVVPTDSFRCCSAWLPSDRTLTFQQISQIKCQFDVTLESLSTLTNVDLAIWVCTKRINPFVAERSSRGMRFVLLECRFACLPVFVDGTSIFFCHNEIYSPIHFPEAVMPPRLEKQR
jgi:hypothetical protein